MNRFFLFCFLIVFFAIIVAGVAFAQDAPGPEEGGHEVQIWAGGGHSVPGGLRTLAFLMWGCGMGG